jgi:hypothetical protein
MYFGFNPRRCFQASARPAALVEGKVHILQKISEIPSGQNLLDIFFQTRSTKSVSHTIFQLSPINEERLFHEAEVSAVSPWALHRLLEAYEVKQRDASYTFYKLIASRPDAGSLRGQMFEKQALTFFGLLKNSEEFTIRRLGDTATSKWVYPGSTECAEFQLSTVTKLLEDAVNGKKALHLIPQAQNFAAVDSILYNPDKVLTCLQFTVRMEHPVAVSGLQKIQGCLQNDPLRQLRPKVRKSKHWKLIFVVPSKNAARFEMQSFRHDTPNEEWSRKVDQYVLGLEEATMWGRTMINEGSNSTVAL